MITEIALAIHQAFYCIAVGAFIGLTAMHACRLLSKQGYTAEKKFGMLLTLVIVVGTLVITDHMISTAHYRKLVENQAKIQVETSLRK